MSSRSISVTFSNWEFDCIVVIASFSSESADLVFADSFCSSWFSVWFSVVITSKSLAYTLISRRRLRVSASDFSNVDASSAILSDWNCICLSRSVNCCPARSNFRRSSSTLLWSAISRLFWSSIWISKTRFSADFASAASWRLSRSLSSSFSASCSACFSACSTFSPSSRFSDFSTNRLRESRSKSRMRCVSCSWATNCSLVCSSACISAVSWFFSSASSLFCASRLSSFCLKSFASALANARSLLAFSCDRVVPFCCSRNRSSSFTRASFSSMCSSRYSP
mmetsp:Transcript_2265/g.5346  ORF Transcript_2265/g.5346 Transcript_2265/m.5346 type:complete len:281 (+) Transcript_2265:1311-2153(+)